MMNTLAGKLITALITNERDSTIKMGLVTALQNVPTTGSTIPNPGYINIYNAVAAIPVNFTYTQLANMYNTLPSTTGTTRPIPKPENVALMAPIVGEALQATRGQVNTTQGLVLSRWDTQPAQQQQQQQTQQRITPPASTSGLFVPDGVRTPTPTPTPTQAVSLMPMSGSTGGAFSLTGDQLIAAMREAMIYKKEKNIPNDVNTTDAQNQEIMSRLLAKGLSRPGVTFTQFQEALVEAMKNLTPAQLSQLTALFTQTPTPTPTPIPTPPNAISSVPPSTMASILPATARVSPINNYTFTNQSVMLNASTLAQKIRSAELMIKCNNYSPTLPTLSM
jgi:hypothetical protein